MASISDNFPGPKRRDNILSPDAGKLHERPCHVPTRIALTDSGFNEPFSILPVFQFCEVGLEVEMPFLCLPKDLLQHEDVGVRRVDQLGLDLGSDHVAQVDHQVADLVVGVSVFHQSETVNERKRCMLACINKKVMICIRAWCSTQEHVTTVSSAIHANQDDQNVLPS